MNKTGRGYAIAAILAILWFFIAGCGTSDPLVNPAQTLPSSYVDSALLSPLRQFDWTNYRLGHWEYDQGIGWTWVPGYVWSASHVVWFTGYEYLDTAPVPPPEVVLPRQEEVNSAVQGSFNSQKRRVRGEFDETNLRAILDKIRIHRVVATTRQILRVNLAMDFPLTFFTIDSIPPLGPPPVPHFFWVNP